jgi:hypothetical protein
MLIAFSQQQWLHERASMLRYTNIAILDKNEMRLKLEGVVNPK